MSHKVHGIGIPAIKKFWIRPEDMEFYEDYIDVCEFNGKYDQQSAFYKVYAKNKKWVGDLRILISDLNIEHEISGENFIPYFGKKRSFCQHQCFQGKQCDICNSAMNLSTTLKNNNLKLIFKEGKEEEDNGERTSEQTNSNE